MGPQSPQGYTTCNKYIYLGGVVTPFNEFLKIFLQESWMAPTQVHPNGYTLINSLYALFMMRLNHALRFRKLTYLISFKNRSDSPSLLIDEAYNHFKVIEALDNKHRYFKSKYFFIHCPYDFKRFWLSGRKSPLLTSFFIQISFIQMPNSFSVSFTDLPG